jgi:hypothetical protein
MLINAEDSYQDLREEFEKIKPWNRGGKKRKKKKEKEKPHFILLWAGGGEGFFPFLLFSPVNLLASMSVFSRYMKVVRVSKRGYSRVR